jgi:small-conductance mechanosensitive channel
VLAVILAVRVLGIDLSNIALVAGALSVGIGLGLQNIVNNFVSGLILLIERPVKAGDWVAVGDKQGLVRRINVRSTELSTFERSTVILPNSQLLSSPVVNWTHKDKVGRIDVRVVVAFGADTEKVRDTLLACAQAHPEILPRPQPSVLFLEFGDTALIFELRAFLRDVEKRARVGSDLRFSIEKSFREAQIELPYAPGRTGKSPIQVPSIEKAPNAETAPEAVSATR